MKYTEVQEDVLRPSHGEPILLNPISVSDCPELTIGNGSVSTTTVIYTTVVTITCNANFSLEGESVLTCVSNGLWNYDIPRCTKGNYTP